MSLSQTYGEMVASLDDVFDALRAAGSPVTSSTRFHQYRPLLVRLHNGSIAAGDRAFWNVAHHAVNETKQLLAIAALLRSRDVPDWPRHIVACLDGPLTPCGSIEFERLPGSLAVAGELQGSFADDFHRVGELAALAHLLTCPISEIFSEAEVVRDPPQSQQHDPGRAFQFQHYAAVHFAEAGLDVSFEQEPDARIVVPGIGSVGLAAKRLMSLKKLRSNLKGAAKQIAGQHLKGLIALDFTVAFDLHRKLFVVNSIDEVRALHPALDLALRNGPGMDVARWIQNCSAGEAARGVIGHAAVLVFVRATKAFGTAHQWYGGPVWAPDPIGWDFLRSVTGSAQD